MVVDFQNAFLRTRHAPRPVVAAPFAPHAGRRRRGGARLPGRARRGRAVRSAASRSRRPDPGRLAAALRWRPARRRARATIRSSTSCRSSAGAPSSALATARVSAARRTRVSIGYLRQGDSISMGAPRRSSPTPKQIALGLARAGYRPPPPRRIRVMGEGGQATLKQGAHQPPGRSTRSPAHDRRRLRPPRPRAVGAGRCPPARRSASSTSSTSSVKGS